VPESDSPGNAYANAHSADYTHTDPNPADYAYSNANPTDYTNSNTNPAVYRNTNADPIPRDNSLADTDRYGDGYGDNCTDCDTIINSDPNPRRESHSSGAGAQPLDPDANSDRR
jgi:hypothetical protein